MNATEPSVSEAVSAFKAAHPRNLGLHLPFYISNRKAVVLLIDDKPKTTKDYLDKTLVPPESGTFSGNRRPLEHFFCIESFDPLVHEHPASIEAALRTSISDFASSPSRDIRRFDLLLVDLSLGEKQSVEPAGYQLLPILRRFFPGIPIFAFTRYNEMRYIRRAFARGATWFLPKAEAWKLPQHFLESIQDRRWQEEWLAIGAGIDWDFRDPNGSESSDENRYLIWKQAEVMPGGKIRVEKRGGGIGGALTLQISREINNRFDLAGPVVIKIDDRFRMLMERERYLRFIHPYLSNVAGRVEQPLAEGGGNRASIAYSYAGAGQGRGEGMGDGRKVVALEEMLTEYLGSGPKDASYEQACLDVVGALLEGILPGIHRVDPRGEQSEPDYPNSIFDEYDNPLDSYLMRMPPEAVVALESPFLGEEEACVNKTLDGFGQLAPEQSLEVSVCEVEQGKLPFIKAVARLKDGNLHRLDVKGTLGEFYASHRNPRLMQPLKLPVTGAPTRGERESWEGLWTTDGANLIDGGLDALSFESSGLRFASPLANAVVALRRWLASKANFDILSSCKIGIVHGDLNLGNVMVEVKQQNKELPTPVVATPWLIDFARTRRDRIVSDYTQLEVDMTIRLIGAELFPSTDDGLPNWDCIEQFFSAFVKTPDEVQPLAKLAPKLTFIHSLMRLVRNTAKEIGVEDEQYLASRIFQLLIVHKIMCGKWKKNPLAEKLRFCCVLSLKLAFDGARILGWQPDER